MDRLQFDVFPQARKMLEITCKSIRKWEDSATCVPKGNRRPKNKFARFSVTESRMAVPGKQVLLWESTNDRLWHPSQAQDTELSKHEALNVITLFTWVGKGEELVFNNLKLEHNFTFTFWDWFKLNNETAWRSETTSNKFVWHCPWVMVKFIGKLLLWQKDVGWKQWMFRNVFIELVQSRTTLVRRTSASKRRRNLFSRSQPSMETMTVVWTSSWVHAKIVSWWTNHATCIEPSKGGEKKQQKFQHFVSLYPQAHTINQNKIR